MSPVCCFPEYYQYITRLISSIWRAGHRTLSIQVSKGGRENLSPLAQSIFSKQHVNFLPLRIFQITLKIHFLQNESGLARSYLFGVLIIEVLLNSSMYLSIQGEYKLNVHNFFG